MVYRTLLSLLAIPILAVGVPGSGATAPATDHPAFTAAGELKLPERYREWVYLTSGLDMSYAPQPEPGGITHSRFDNVFVNPSSYQSFLTTGTWPHGTTLVLEVRGAEPGVSINRRGQTQSAVVMALEVHVKDEAGKWGFFEFGDNTVAPRLPETADCYSCHQQHGAVDTTFVQFYPTLLGLAKAKNTLSAEYLKDQAATAPHAGSAP